MDASTGEARVPCRARRCFTMAAVLMTAGLLVAAPAGAQGVAAGGSGSGDARGAVALSFAAGLGIPSGAVFRDIYGSQVWPLSGQVEWRITSSGLGVFGGVRRVTRGGRALTEGASQPSEEQVEFTTTSWRIGPSWSLIRGRWGFTVAGGPSYVTYREAWDTAGLSQEDSRLGFVVQGTLDRQLTRRVSVLLRLEQSLLNADPPEDTGLGSVNLGATDIAAGLAFRF